MQQIFTPEDKLYWRCFWCIDWSKIPPMHIPDGFLSTRIAVAMNIVSATSILYAVRRIKIDFSGRRVPIMGMLAAFVFAAQMLNFPILGGTSGHLIGGSLLAIILGPMAGSLTLTTVIIAQSLFLQDGGLIALGANIFNISVVPCFSGYAVFRLVGRGKYIGKRLVLAGFLAGWISLLISSALCALQMALSGVIDLRIGLTAMVGYYAVIGVFEGILTAGVLSFLFKVRPDLMSINEETSFGVWDWIGALIFVAIPSAILILAGSSHLPDPLEKMIAAAPRLSTMQTPAESIALTGRYMDYIIRGAVFILLIGFVYLVSRLARHWRNSR
jgi:cobalt/nickel transport system permease protein